MILSKEESESQTFLHPTGIPMDIWEWRGPKSCERLELPGCQDGPQNSTARLVFWTDQARRTFKAIMGLPGNPCPMISLPFPSPILSVAKSRTRFLGTQSNEHSCEHVEVERPEV
jgi:hypothetical protein